jgi:hypothetical protein
MPLDMLTGAVPDPLAAALDRALRAVPPAWPLEATVAVNPFLGQAGEDLATAAARLARVGGFRIAMPRRWYAERIVAGAITSDDLRAAWAAADAARRPADPEVLTAALASSAPAPQAAPTVADLAAAHTGTDWPEIIAHRLGAFCGDWFDQGQALWPQPRRGSLFASWQALAMRDLTPEVLGLPGFCAHVAAAPADGPAAMRRALEALGAPPASWETFLHRLLMSLGGWGQLARQRLFQAELAGGTDTTLADLLAIRLVWEEALLARHAPAIGPAWQATVARHAAPVEPAADDVTDAILQEAAERSAQRKLGAALAAPASPAGDSRPALQMAFCIDVRSEVFRRALESLDAGIRTLGFAGFFGLPVAHRPFASDMTENRLPVLLRPSVMTCAAVPGEDAAERQARIGARARRAWGRFSQAAVSSFAFVESAGLLHAWSLLARTLGRTPAPALQPPPRLPDGLDLDQRVAAADAVLRAMSFTQGFAPLVLLAGHGAQVVNNPHASALACGACGGFSGDVSARLLAALLNDAAVRAGLAARGITIPSDTLFVAALHDTVSDAVTLFRDDGRASDAALRQAETWLAQAAALARAERATRLPRASAPAELPRRGRDWAEVRPEWGLAGCHALIAAPRRVTAGRDLGGRAFLHDYDWRADQGFSVLELILTAPVVVASWISLQYYGSVVAPEAFGAGNKLLHNVVGGVGVAEGNGGLLRAGLPWQSVHDGEQLMHEPLRLTVLLAAPREAVEGVLSRQPDVRALFDNRWLHLLLLDDDGRVAWRYRRAGEWDAEEFRR